MIPGCGQLADEQSKKEKVEHRQEVPKENIKYESIASSPHFNYDSNRFGEGSQRLNDFKLESKSRPLTSERLEPLFSKMTEPQQNSRS
jgi:hypothetical protein